MDHTVQQVLDAVTAESTKVDSLIALVATLKGQIGTVTGLTAEQQTQINSIFAGVTAEAAAVQAALDANTTAPVPPAPGPTTTGPT